MLFDILRVLTIAVAIYWIASWMARRDIDKKAMRCPNCDGNRICPVTDSVWGCVECDALFSINSIE